LCYNRNKTYIPVFYRGNTVLQQAIYIKTMCPNYILEVRNTQSHLLKVYLGVWALKYVNG